MISAFRYTLSDSSRAYNDVLRPLIVPLLVTMLSDRDLGNHRLALTTLNSAIHNKMNIILPHLNELLPAVIGDTHIKPELMREVQMGPFKHKVDDGLELRKVSIRNSYRTKSKATEVSNHSIERLRNSLRLSGHRFLPHQCLRILRPHPGRYRRRTRHPHNLQPHDC